jgi:hypothetical protein
MVRSTAIKKQNGFGKVLVLNGKPDVCRNIGQGLPTIRLTTRKDAIFMNRP